MVPISIYRRAHFATTARSSVRKSPTWPFTVLSCGRVTYDDDCCATPPASRLQELQVHRHGDDKARVDVSPPRSSPSRRPVRTVLVGYRGVVVVSALLVAAVDDQWRVLNRLRAIAEHGGMLKSDDRRLTTHNVRQHLLAVSGSSPTTPVGTWPPRRHGVPWHNLPAYHANSNRGLRDGRHHVRELLPTLAQRHRALSFVAVLNLSFPSSHRHFQSGPGNVTATR